MRIADKVLNIADRVMGIADRNIADKTIQAYKNSPLSKKGGVLIIIVLHVLSSETGQHHLLQQVQPGK